MIKRKLLLEQKEFFTLKKKDSTEILFKSTLSDIPVVIAELKDDYLAEVITKGLKMNDISKSPEHTFRRESTKTYINEELWKVSDKEKHHTIMYFLGMVFSITNLILLLQILLFKT